MGNLKSVRLIYIKGLLFLVCGLMSFTLLLLQSPNSRTVILLCLMVWSFCRCYFFAFYVIERYVDGHYRFTGLWDFAKYCLRASRREQREAESDASIHRKPPISYSDSG